MTKAALKDKLHDYIDTADAKTLRSINNFVEQNEEGQSREWWNDKAFVAELDARYEAIENGTDKGKTWEELEGSIDKLRKKRYDR